MLLFLRTFQLGLKSLWLHPLRSALTILGIFIGVASVIWLLAIGEGISLVAQRQIESLGALNIIVRSVKPPADATAGFTGPVVYGLKRSEFEMLEETIPHLAAPPLPIREVPRVISYGRNEVDGRLVGSTPDYCNAMQLKMKEGAFFTELHSEQGSNVCVLAERLAEKLFPLESPLGNSVYLSENKDFYRVIGVIHHRNPTAAVGGSLASQDFDSDMYVPINTLRRQVSDLVVQRRGSSFSAEIVELDQITLRVSRSDQVRRTAELIRYSLGLELEADRDASAAPTGQDPPASRLQGTPRRDVAVVVPEELLEQARITKLMFMLFMGLNAAISLLVGGIGIMNIMLATVTERTREIGIRRALGAARRHIVWQFLAETISLSVVGGLCGIAGGLLCPIMINAARDVALQSFGELVSQLPVQVREMEPVVVGWSLPLAFGISVLVGVVFGIYPAMRAARMDPIEALRHE